MFCNTCLRNWYHHISQGVQEPSSVTLNALGATREDNDFGEDDAINDASIHTEDEVECQPLACPLCRTEILSPPVFADRARQVVGTVNVFLTLFEPLSDREHRLSNNFHRIIDTDQLVSNTI